MSNDLEVVPKHQVRKFIGFFEQNIEHRQTNLKRSKSFADVRNYKDAVKIKLQELNRSLNIEDLDEVEKELIRVTTHLTYYQKYDKETHAEFHKDLLHILSLIAQDYGNKSEVVEKKKHLVGEIKRTFEHLNDLLPSNEKLVVRKPFMYKPYSTTGNQDNGEIKIEHENDDNTPKKNEIERNTVIKNTYEDEIKDISVNNLKSFFENVAQTNGLNSLDHLAYTSGNLTNIRVGNVLHQSNLNKSKSSSNLINNYEDDVN